MLRTALAQNLPSNMADLATVVKHAQSMQPSYWRYMQCFLTDFIVISWNKMAVHVRGLCTGNHWELVVHRVYKIEKGPRWGIYSIIESIWAYFCTHLRFLVCFPIRSHFTLLQGVYYFLLLLSNGSMSQTLHTTPIFYTTCWSFFHPHTSTPVLFIVTSLWISAIANHN